MARDPTRRFMISVVCGWLLLGTAAVGARQSGSRAAVQVGGGPPPAADGRFSAAFSPFVAPTPADEPAGEGDAIGRSQPPRGGLYPYPWGLPPGHAYPFAFPAYGYPLGVVPSYYSWYHPQRSTASVTYVGKGATREVRATGEAVAYVPRVLEAMADLGHDAQRVIAEAVGAFRDRDYRAAAGHLRRAIPIDPDNGLVRFQYALAQFSLGDYEGASYSLRRGLDLLPEWVESGQNLRALYGRDQDFADHLASLQSHVRIEPDDVEARVVLGYVEFLTGQVDDAARSFAWVAQRRSEDPVAPLFLDEIERIRDRVAQR